MLIVHLLLLPLQFNLLGLGVVAERSSGSAQGVDVPPSEFVHLVSFLTGHRGLRVGLPIWRLPALALLGWAFVAALVALDLIDHSRVVPLANPRPLVLALLSAPTQRLVRGKTSEVGRQLLHFFVLQSSFEALCRVINHHCRGRLRGLSVLDIEDLRHVPLGLFAFSKQESRGPSTHSTSSKDEERGPSPLRLLNIAASAHEHLGRLSKLFVAAGRPLRLGHLLLWLLLKGALAATRM